MRPNHNISFDQANSLLAKAQPLSDAYVSGEIKIEAYDSWEKEVIMKNCTLEYFSGSATQFKKPVHLVNCRFKKCQFVFSYFLERLIIENCLFDDYLDFQAGGHNKNGKPIILANNQFAGFVNFFDCWYESEVIIKNNDFKKGANLLGKPFDIPVTFDVVPIIEDNKGQLNLDTEG
jgi:hypothetical protein